ncbi:TPA: NAD-dependent malic enzyme, partial [Enterococcus faecium]
GAAILPPVAKITEFSQTIAETVAKSVVAQNLNREEITDIKEAVESAKWVPEYKSLED